MNRNNSSNEMDSEILERIERGKRIKHIRENELHMTKARLAKEIGISAQFLGLVEDGKGNLVYKNIKKLREISGHSADYILFGLDDTIIDKTQEYLEDFSEEQLIAAFDIIKDLALFMKSK